MSRNSTCAADLLVLARSRREIESTAIRQQDVRECTTTDHEQSDHGSPLLLFTT